MLTREQKLQRRKKREAQIIQLADDALNDQFTLQGVTARQRRLAGGGYDWNWKGPNDDPEWAWFFNRHGWLNSVWKAYRKTAANQYFDYIVATLQDWVESNPPPRRFNFSAAWRPLEAARRLLYIWLPLLEDWMADERWPIELSQKLKQSLYEHGVQLRKHHALSGNHLITEMRALLTLAYQCPELNGAADWVSYSLNRLDRAYQQQVYSDGVHMELSSHYHRIIAQNYLEVLQLVSQFSGDALLISKWESRVDALWNYIFQITKPNNTNPLNNDCDAEDFKRIIKKAGFEQRLKEVEGCAHFPWAGHSILRGAERAHWSFFDHGPRGTDHEHQDFNNFTLSLGLRDFLVDAGRYTYEPGAWRDYFVGPEAHNVVLFNGLACDQGPREAAAPLDASAFEVRDGNAVAVGKSLFFDVRRNRIADWSRTVRYKVDLSWEVQDEIISFGSQKIVSFWHFHPDCEISGDLATGEGVIVRHGKKTLSMNLVSHQSAPAEIEILCGQSQPRIQGWYSAVFNQKIAAPVMRVEQSMRGPINNKWIFKEC